MSGLNSAPAVRSLPTGAIEANAVLAKVLGSEHPGLHPEDTHDFAQWLNRGTPDPQHDARLEGPNGTYRWIRFLCRPGNDAWTPAVDITDLMTSRDHMQVAVESLPDLLFELDRDARYIAYFSPEERLFAPPEAFMGRTVAEIMPEPLSTQFTQAIRIVADGGSCQPIGYALPLQDGLAHFEARFNRSPRGTVLVVVRDVTLLAEYQATLQQQNEELDRRNQELEELSYLAAHDLRAPALHITEFLRRLHDEASPTLSDGGSTLLTFARGAAEKLLSQLEGLNRLTHINQGQMTRSAVDLAELVTKQWHALDTDSATLTVHGNAGVHGDEAMLSAMVDALLDNAVTYRNPQRACAIDVHIEIEEQTAILRIVDNGLGIAEENQKRAFRLFQRLHLDNEIPGIGIGLVIASHIASRHRGSLQMHSDGQTGSTFEVRLPLGQA